MEQIGTIIGRIIRRVFGPDEAVNAEEKIAHLAEQRGMQDLNWRESVVDLLKVLGLDSSPGARQRLAQELGYRDGSSDEDMNTWLHGQVMAEIAANSGKIET